MKFKTSTTCHLLSLVLLAIPALAQNASTASPLHAVSMVRRLNPVYPYDMLIKGKAGNAEVRFTVEYSGRAIFTQTTSASDPQFGKALVAEIESNEFIPPRINGQPQLAASAERFNFEGETLLDPIAREILENLRNGGSSLVPVESLDKKPAQLRKEPPVFPFSLQSDGLSGKAELEFVIDRDGRVLFPHILSSTYEDFGWSAATAAVRWKFEPPVKDGKHVDARAHVTVTFDARTFTATW